MSLINDALNKVQQQRGERVTAQAVVRYSGSHRPAEVKAPPARISPAVWVLINAGVLVLILAFNHFFSRDTSPEAQPAATVVASAPDFAPVKAPFSAPVAETTPVRIKLPLPSTPAAAAPSPFVASGTNPPDSASADVDYDLAGMTVVGKNTLLSITRRSDQRSFWIPVGKTVGEVTAVSYNPESDDAVIRVRGRLMTIVMRNAGVYFNPVTPANQ